MNTLQTSDLIATRHRSDAVRGSAMLLMAAFLLAASLRADVKRSALPVASGRSTSGSPGAAQLPGTISEPDATGELDLADVGQEVLDWYTLDWYTIDGGGGMWTAGGPYELSGTIGQPDAGVAMTGGPYELVGGFWAVRLVSAFATGDLNCDGSVGFGDINPFVLYLSNFAAWQATYSGCPPEVGDINGDGLYPDFEDINPFVALLTGG